MSYDTLGFVDAAVVGSGGARRYRDFAINGTALSSLVQIGGKIGGFAALAGAERQRLVKQLLRRQPSALSSGRCPIYLCAECGGLDCGTVSVRVSEIEDCFVWSELSYEDPVGGGRPVAWFDDRDERDFYFARADYLAAIY